MNKKIYIGAILVFAVISMAITYGPGHDDFWDNYKPTNLKVLPKNINNARLHTIMVDFSDALGVKCSFCHAFKKGGKHLDFASDANHKKDIARGMMKMTDSINGQYFLKYQKGNKNLHLVSCITCHNGAEHPKVITAMRDSTAF